MKNAVAIYHVAFEGAGTLGPVLDERGIGLTYLQAGRDDLSPALDADLILILGGPIGIYEFDRYPFLKDEMKLIEEVVKKNTPAVGICLGAQALAAVFGARVYPGKEKELGWDQLILTDEGKASPLGVLEGLHILNVTVIRSICPQAPRASPPPRSRPTKRSHTGPTCWRCNSTLNCPSKTWSAGSSATRWN